MDRQKKLFPKNFLWGASTSAHQVEGGTFNQWSVWELANASRKAKTMPNKKVSPHSPVRTKDLPIWPEIEHQAVDPANYVSGKGVDHYNRYKEDFDLIKKINLNTFRFGIEWSRIEPEEGKWDEKEVEHYRNYIHELRKRGIEPVLNIWHWTNPVWFEEKGAFKKRRNIKYFSRFVKKLGQEYAQDLSYVITINEPNNYAAISYAFGEWPPQEKNLISASIVYFNMVSVHKQAYRILKKIKPTLNIGIANQLANIQAKRPHNFIDEFITQTMRYFWNWWFINRINKYQDFVGVNYYFSDYYKGFKIASPSVPVSDLGWYMEPEGLYPLLLRAWAHYHKPIIVTEVGVADMHDQYREWWIQQTIMAIERALSEGIIVKGYFYWSLLDNFEWSNGWWPKFGLVEVDRHNNMERKIRPSAKWFAKKIDELKNFKTPY